MDGLELIKSLGEYDAAKLHLGQLKICRWITPEMQKIERALLAYRRDQGFYEIGDYVCIVSDRTIEGYNDGIYRVLDIGDLVFLRDKGEVRKIHSNFLRHATPKEIKAGRRIESSNSQVITDCNFLGFEENDSQNGLLIKKEDEK